MDPQDAQDAAISSTSPGSNTDADALVSSVGALALTTTEGRASNLLELPNEILLMIVERMTNEQQMLFALTSSDCRQVYNTHFLPKEEYLWQRRIANLVYLARDEMTLVACNGRPKLHWLDLDVDEPWHPVRVKPCDSVNPGSPLVGAGFKFTDDLFIRHVHLETILKFVLHFDRLHARQRQFLATLLMPQSLPETPYFALHAPPPNVERGPQTLSPQGDDVGRELMGMGWIKYFKVERHFELRVVMKEDKVAETARTPAVIAKLTYSLQKVDSEDIEDDTRFAAMPVCRHRKIDSAIKTAYWMRRQLARFTPTDLHFNEIVAKEINKSGKQVEWTCPHCATWFAVDSHASDTMEVKVLADLGGQGLPFSNEWLSLVTPTIWEGEEWDKRGLEEVFEKDGWIAPDSE